MIAKGWFTCPGCRKKLQRVTPDTILHGTPVYCRKCHVEWFPDIYEGRELETDEPFPLKTES